MFEGTLLGCFSYRLYVRGLKTESSGGLCIHKYRAVVKDIV